MNTKGSEWRKWDLHVHTPESIVHDYKKGEANDVWEKYFIELENLPSDIKVLGINDYWFLDGYSKVKEYKDNGGLKNIDLILPVIEFRLRDYVGSNQLNKINYHVIFSNELEVSEIEEEFLKRLEINEFENRSLSKDNLIKFGEKVKENTPEAKRKNLPSSLLQIGFNNYTVQLETLNKLLEKDYLKNKFIKVIGQTEWKDFRWEGSSSDKQALINGCDFVFSASSSIENAISSKKSLSDELVNDNLLHCSDAHEFYTAEYTSKVLGHCYTWIKSDTTFEGLKQVIYEASRVYLGENKPQEPIYKLESINLKFDENTKWDKDNFCFSGEREPTLFSPYFNCIIGGRGSGKSTFVNLIAHQTGYQDKVKTFFKDLKIDNNITLNPNYLDNIEFIAQSDIDRFAKDTTEFTNALFTRLDKLSGGTLTVKEAAITSSLENIDFQISRLKFRDKLNNELLKLRKNLSKDNNLIRTFQDKKYKKAKKELDNVTKELGLLEKSRIRYKELYNSLKAMALIKKVETDSITNEYDTLYNSLIEKINTLYKDTKLLDYSEGKEKIRILQINKGRFSKQIKEYLISKGLTEDSLNDMSNAHDNIDKTKDLIQITIQHLRKVKIEIEEFNFAQYKIDNFNFSELINQEIEKINTKFSNIQSKNPNDVKLIKVNFNINENILYETITKLIKTLEIDSIVSGVRSSFYDYIMRGTDLSIIDTQEYDDFFINFRDNPKVSTTTSTYQIIEEILNNKLNFDIYKLLLKKTIYDIKNNKVLEVLYDNKTLDKSSYGQRCTTVLIILISLGNNPIIIDEPEAHLDSSLIANYLVELIKSMKKHRQIIFATHNANFVLNGDAELIIKLDNIDNFSTFTSFTIEDTLHRDDLLQLEGGIEAFQKRERKYNIDLGRK